MKIPHDKKLHLGCGAAIGFLGASLTDPLVGLTLGVVAGAAKEMYDQYDYGGADWQDMLATVVGAAIGVAVYVYVI